MIARSVDAGSSFASSARNFLMRGPIRIRSVPIASRTQLCQVAIVFVGKVRFRHGGELGVADPREESSRSLRAAGGPHSCAFRLVPTHVSAAHCGPIPLLTAVVIDLAR